LFKEFVNKVKEKKYKISEIKSVLNSEYHSFTYKTIIKPHLVYHLLNSALGRLESVVDSEYIKVALYMDKKEQSYRGINNIICFRNFVRESFTYNITHQLVFKNSKSVEEVFQEVANSKEEYNHLSQYRVEAIFHLFLVFDIHFVEKYLLGFEYSYYPAIREKFENKDKDKAKKEKEEQEKKKKELLEKKARRRKSSNTAKRR